MDQGKIVAIGGGSVYTPCQPPQTLAIDKYIVGLSKKVGERTNVLFVPTASGDDLGYCNSIYTLYELCLGCRFDHLRLVEKLSDRQIVAKINWASIIYVGGGNTLKMMNAWRRRGIDRLLVKAYSEGKVMCGLSAGAICWFDWGCSDSLKKPGQTNFKPIKVSGLGLISGGLCPHWDSELWRQQAFPGMLKKTGEKGLALEDCVAYAKVGNDNFLVSSKTEESKAYRFCRTETGKIMHGSWTIPQCR